MIISDEEMDYAERLRIIHVFSCIKLLYLLSDGADPTGSIDEYFKKHKQFPTGKISMGEA